MNMKILINENNLKVTIKSMIKELGVQSAIAFLGGRDTFTEVMNIKTPMDFLHLFDDLASFVSTEKPKYILFRHKKGDNIFTYNRNTNEVDVNRDGLWRFLEGMFGLTYSEVNTLILEWLSEVYNLKNVSISKYRRTMLYDLE